jgi:hypothetical protein
MVMRDHPDWSWLGTLVGLVIAGIVVRAVIATLLGQ